MNIKDFPDVEVPEGDMLEGIFSKQGELIEKYEPIERERGAITVDPEQFGQIDYRFVQWRLKDLSQRVIEELMECTNTLRNKPWKQSEVETDVDHFLEELSDTLHFFVEFCITAGVDARLLAQLYHKKHAVNRFRQDSNY